MPPIVKYILLIPLMTGNGNILENIRNSLNYLIIIKYSLYKKGE